MLSEYRKQKLDVIAEWALLSLSIVGIGLIIASHGFYLKQPWKSLLETLQFSILFFLLLVYAYKYRRAKTIKLMKQARLYILLLVSGLTIEILVELTKIHYRFTGQEIHHLIHKSIMTIVQVSIVAQYFYSLAALNDRILGFRFRPGSIVLLSFLLMILAGTGLLMLPRAVNPGQNLSWIDALFTSTSAVCVTGLITVDTATVFSPLGKGVLVLLMQAGGLGILTLVAFFTSTLGRSLSMKSEMLLVDVISDESTHSVGEMLKRIMIFTFTFELIGMLFLFLFWMNAFDDPVVALGYSLFHSVSAFCNAGFSLFTENLYSPLSRSDPGVILTVSMLIIIGGIGFSTMHELRERWRPRFQKSGHPPHRVSLQTRIILITSLVLIIIGGAVFFLLESNSVLEGLSWPQKVLHSFFQSVTTRTAGFNTVPIEKLAVPTLMFFLILMFIGGAPGSTAGGVKVTTIAISFLSLKSLVMSEKRLVFRMRNIPFRTFNNAMIILVFSVTLVVLSVFFLSITEAGHSLEKIIFEEVSAFGTVGLSAGLTGELSLPGKLIIILNMFIGRVGPLTLALALGRQKEKVEVEYPEEPVMVG